MLERGFDTLLTEAAALGRLAELISPSGRSEMVPLEEADGRVVADSPRAPRDVPHYDRCAMDGYAVRAEDTAGASPAGPVRLALEETAGPFRAVRVHTGSPLPPGTDAVLPVEDAERREGRLDALRRVRSGEHVGRRGEDIRVGEPAVAAGRRLCAADLGLLRSLGIERVRVAERPRIVVLATGEELVGPGEEPAPGRMVDANGIVLATLVQRWGGTASVRPLYSDRAVELGRELAALADAGNAPDLVVTTGGTSVGERDRVVEALRSAGEVAFHGVAIQPARPVAAGRVGTMPVLCLPGFPAAAYIAAFAFLRPALERLSGCSPARPPTCRGRLSRKIVSTLGLRSYTRVRVEDGRVEPVRTSGAGILSSIARSQGFVVTPEDSEGVPAGAEVEVLLLD